MAVALKANDDDRWRGKRNRTGLQLPDKARVIGRVQGAKVSLSVSGSIRHVPLRLRQEVQVLLRTVSAYGVMRRTSGK